MNWLLIFRGFADNSQRVLTAVYRLALVSVELGLNVIALELRVASFAHADGGRVLFHDPQFALCHAPSLVHREGGA